MRRARSRRGSSLTFGNDPMRAITITAAIIAAAIFTFHLIGDTTYIRRLQWAIATRPPGENLDVLRDTLRLASWRTGMHSVGLILQVVIIVGVLRTRQSRRST